MLIPPSPSHSPLTSWHLPTDWAASCFHFIHKSTVRMTLWRSKGEPAPARLGRQVVDLTCDDDDESSATITARTNSPWDRMSYPHRGPADEERAGKRREDHTAAKVNDLPRQDMH